MVLQNRLVLCRFLLPNPLPHLRPAALFGSGKEALGSLVDTADAMRLVLAAAVIPTSTRMRIAHTEGESDEQDPDSIGSFQWE